MKKTIEFISLLSAIVGLAPLITGIYSIIKLFKADTTNKPLYIIIFFICISSIAGIIILYLVYTNKQKKGTAYKIEKNLDLYINGEGQSFIQNNTNKELVKHTKDSIKVLIKKGITNTLESEVYYMYLFAMLNGATNRIWAASIMGEEEWVDTPEEEEFLRLNINASKRKVLVERIFIIEKKLVKKMLSNKLIQEQIDKRTDYFKTYIIAREELNDHKPNLLTDIGSGFLAFDDFAVASDVFQDSFIRGILTLDEETIKRNNRIFTNLRDFAKPLDKIVSASLLLS